MITEKRGAFWPRFLMVLYVKQFCTFGDEKPILMKKQIATFSVSLFVLALMLTSCNSNPKSSKAEVGTKLEAEKGIHDRDAHGEEDGTQLGIDDVYDVERKGTHLVLKYDSEAKAFTGTVENVSNEVLDRVRVEVHLSNGTELGPTTQVDLKPGEKREVLLAVESDDFDGWSTHAEVGDSEHSHEGEGEHEHQ
jgi:hypothetical protein